MRSDTRVSAGWRNVGDAKSPPMIMEDAPISLVLKGLIQWIGVNSIAKRFEIIIGSDPEYIKQKLNDSRNSKKLDAEEFDDAIAAMLERVPDDESTNNEDNWTPPRLGATNE